MKKKVILYSVLILLVFTLVLSLKISYSKYTLQVESDSITINTKAYTELTISSITSVENEDDTYNITVSNSNGYDVNFFVEAQNTNDLNQGLNVIQYDTQGSNGQVDYWTVGASTTKVVKVKIEKSSGVAYTTTESGTDFIIPVTINVKGIYPYKAADVTNNSVIALVVDNTFLYNIEYSANGGTGTTESQTNIVEDQDVVLRNCGYTGPSVTVTFNANDGNCSTASLSENRAFSLWKNNDTNTTYSAGQTVRNLAESGTVTLSAEWGNATFTLPEATKEGFAFDGWYTSLSNGTRVGGAGSTVGLSETTELYAIFTEIINPEYTVTFDLNGYNANETPASLTGTSVVLPSITPLSYSDEVATYEFIGWQINNEGYLPGETYTPTENITAFAEYTTVLN